MYLLTGLGFIINMPKSKSPPNPENRVPGSAGGLHLTTPEAGAPPHPDGGEPASEELTGDSTVVSSTDMETACCFSGSPTVPAPLFLLVTSGRLSESSALQQPELHVQYNTLLSLSAPAQGKLTWWQKQLAQ